MRYLIIVLVLAKFRLNLTVIGERIVFCLVYPLQISQFGCTFLWNNSIINMHAITAEYVNGIHVIIWVLHGYTTEHGPQACAIIGI